MAKILIVEDNQGTNKAICEYMKEAGHTLFSAFTGSEALKIFREKELDTPPDLPSRRKHRVGP